MFRFQRLKIRDRKNGAGKEEKKMKKLIALLCVLLMMVCAASATAEQLAGGWTPSEDPTVTEERQALFDKGTEALTGVGYTPIAYLGSQVVAGTNHAFLCQAVVVYPGAEPHYAMVYLYEDLQGNVSILSIAEVDVGALCTYGAEE